MAGEIEEPFRLNFQADLLHSGSISFGRFEAESLSWERRSSFSHNRYLEEVEKYSKPGSVTEKKAYFEAHFRRKALLKQTSNSSQNGREDQTSENNDPHYLEEFDNNKNECTHFTCFDESSHSPTYDKESEIVECEREGAGVLFSEPQTDYEINTNNDSVNVSEFGRPEESHQIEIVNSGVVHNNQEIEVTFLDEVRQVEMLSEHIDPYPASHSSKMDHSANIEVTQIDVTSEEIDPYPNSHSSEMEYSSNVDLHPNSRTSQMDYSASMDLYPDSHTSEMDDSASSGHRQKSSPKVTSSPESKLAKPKLKSQDNPARVKKTSLSESSKGSVKPRKSEVDLRTKTEKKLSQSSVPVTRLVGKTSKAVDLDGAKLNLIHQQKSIGNLRLEKPAQSQSVEQERPLPVARQTSSRTRQTVDSSKLSTSQSPAAFSLKSDQRAVRRKEYYLKLEEKMHAKEAESNQIKAKKQEKTEAEMKQFRKSLNFKATPMPTFYHEPVCSSGRNKVISSNNQSSHLRSSQNLRTGAERPRSYWNAGSESDRPEASGLTNSSFRSDTCPDSPASVNNANYHSDPTKTGIMTEKKEQVKKKDTSSSYKQNVSDERKSFVAEGKNRVGVPTSRIITPMGKDAKASHMGNGSKIGHRAVGVAS